MLDGPLLREIHNMVEGFCFGRLQGLVLAVRRPTLDQKGKQSPVAHKLHFEGPS